MKVLALTPLRCMVPTVQLRVVLSTLPKFPNVPHIEEPVRFPQIHPDLPCIEEGGESDTPANESKAIIAWL